MCMRKEFFWGLLFTTCLIFSGCSANMKYVEHETKEKLENSSLGPYIEKVDYKADKKEDDTTPVNIQAIVDEEFSDLSTMEKYQIMYTTLDQIMGSFNNVYCGENRSCRYKDLKLLYDDDTFVMDIFDKTLVINEFEKYSKRDYDIELANRTYKATPNNTSKYTSQKKEKFASNGMNYMVIFDFMKEQYRILTNNDENYIPEVHDPQVAEIAAKRFGITAKEAGFIYEEVQMDAFK